MQLVEEEDKTPVVLMGHIQQDAIVELVGDFPGEACSRSSAHGHMGSTLGTSGIHSTLHHLLHSQLEASYRLHPCVASAIPW